LLDAWMNLMSLEDRSMAPNRSWVERLVMRIQGEFLDTPCLRLTISQAEQHFEIDRTSCEAVLGALVDANVLSRSADGRYTRSFPRLAHAA
jgi:hypothetical protein